MKYVITIDLDQPGFEPEKGNEKLIHTLKHITAMAKSGMTPPILRCYDGPLQIANCELTND